MSEEPSSSGYHPSDLQFQLPSTSYQTSDSYDPGPAGFLFHIVRLFVHIVQPNAFPEGKSCRWKKIELSSNTAPGHTCVSVVNERRRICSVWSGVRF